MTLTFIDGKFQLTRKRGEPKPHEGWDCVSELVHQTSSIKAAKRYRAFADERAERVFARVLVARYKQPIRPLPAWLDPHQRDGVRYILAGSRSYLAHAPGAGKTAQAVVAALWATVQAGAGRQSLFIVPPSLTVNWAREVMKFWEWAQRPGTSSGHWPAISIIPESKHQAFAGWAASFLICPDSMLHKPWVMKELTARKFRLIAVDEASRFNESTSLRSVALYGGQKGKFKSPGLIQNAKHAVLLDGSPMSKRPIELWAPIFAMAPETIDFMSRQDFGFRYCGAKMNDFFQWEFKGATHQEELRQKLQASFMHVVTEDKLDHAERQRSMLFMNHDPRTPAQRRWERRHLSQLKFEDIDEGMCRGDIASHRAELGLKKTKWVVDYVSSRLKEKGESILLFAWHREVVWELFLALSDYKPAMVRGGTPQAEREKAFADFNEGRTKLVIGNIGAMGRGNNLQKADRVVFAEYSWSDELNRQCEKRASRRGRDSSLPVRCDYVVLPNSMDEIILNSVFTGASNVKRIIG